MVTGPGQIPDGFLQQPIQPWFKKYCIPGFSLCKSVILQRIHSYPVKAGIGKQG
jgi:hypothetical protein